MCSAVERNSIVNRAHPHSPLVLSAFHEWTQGLDTRKSMCSIFSHIRDIPYSLVVPVNDSKTLQEQILVAGKGSCGAKHYLLAEMFQKLNLTLV